jgi:hypothetical protein
MMMDAHVTIRSGPAEGYVQDSELASAVKDLPGLTG